jgi:hypothetical protein
VIACPVCRAENAERTCRRCRADLGLLFDLELQRSTDLAQARRLAIASLTTGDFPTALAHWRRISALTSRKR